MSEQCCRCNSRRHKNLPLHSIETIITAYPIFDQVLEPNFSSDKICCDTCLTSELAPFFYMFMEKDIWFKAVKAFEGDPMLLRCLLYWRAYSCPLCGTDWDWPVEYLTLDEKTKNLFRYIYEKNKFNLTDSPKPVLQKICAECAGKAEVEIIRKVAAKDVPLIMGTAVTKEGKLLLEKRLKESI